MGKREKRVAKSIGQAVAKVAMTLGTFWTYESLNGKTWHDMSQPAMVIPAAIVLIGTLWSIFGTSPVEEYRTPEEG